MRLTGSDHIERKVAAILLLPLVIDKPRRGGTADDWLENRRSARSFLSRLRALLVDFSPSRVGRGLRAGSYIRALPARSAMA
jgi:hypothetical protein